MSSPHPHVTDGVQTADLFDFAAGQIKDAATTLWPGEPVTLLGHVPSVTGYVQRVLIGDRRLFAKASILGVSLVSILRGLYGTMPDVQRAQLAYAARADNLPRREAAQLTFLAELGRPQVCSLAGVHGGVLFTEVADGQSLVARLASDPGQTAALLGMVLAELDDLHALDHRHLDRVGSIDQRGIAATFTRKFSGPDGDAYARTIGAHRVQPEQRRAVMALLRASIPVLLECRPPVSPMVVAYGDLKPEHALFPDSGAPPLLLDPGLRTAWHAEDLARLISRTLLQAVTDMDLPALGKVLAGVSAVVEQHARTTAQPTRWLRNLTTLWLMDTISIVSSYLTAPPDLPLPRQGEAVARRPLLVATVVYKAATALGRHGTASVWESALSRAVQGVLA
ncbi:hypothetical protein [Nonomuraea sp. CA-141351]|uniref:hypothetical protein n=1 Tax=Nonomuraea sp. CA-141351 TaxID=3239996 RepID=UPI003D8EA983